MNRVMMLVMLFLMCFQGAWAQLPPDIQADRHLMSAMKFIESEDYDSAKKEFESIIKLNIKVPNDFYFHYGKTLIKNRNFESGKKMIEKFIGLAGRTSEMYKPALELLSEAENPPKQWRLGPTGCDWNEAQKWINSLGNGWRTPSMAELRALRNSDNEVCKQIKNSSKNTMVWSVREDSSMAWYIYFDNGNEYSGGIGSRYGNERAVAVR